MVRSVEPSPRGHALLRKMNCAFLASTDQDYYLKQAISQAICLIARKNDGETRSNFS
jgi:hypothetical protein